MPGMTETFSNEREAKRFARAKLVDTRNVSAGTLNPLPPKRPSPQRRCSYGLKNRMTTIWLERASTAHARNYPPGKDHFRRGARRWRSGSPDLFPDCRCSHGTTTISGGPDHVRLIFEPLFTCQVCGDKGADVRPNFSWEAARCGANNRAPTLSA
jgi:hypothetical protein